MDCCSILIINYIMHSGQSIYKCFEQINQFVVDQRMKQNLRWFEINIDIISNIQKIQSMTEQLINESQYLHNILIEETNRNITRINQINTLANTVSNLFTNFSNSINGSCRNLFKKLRYDEDEDPSIIFLSKFVVDMLGELTKKFNLVTKKVKNQVIQPMEQFFDSQKESYSQLVIRSGQLFTEIQANSSFLNELNKNFSHNSKSDLSKQEQLDFKKIYECEMKKCNENWLEIKNKYKKLLSDADSTNSFRCNFSIKMEVKVCKILNRLVNSPHVQEALIGYEQISDENQTLSINIKEKIRDKMGKSVLLEEKNMKEFDGLHQFAYKQKNLIDDFISIFTSFSNIKQDETKHEKARSLILGNIHWATYFLTRMRSNLHTEIKLPAVKYHEMTTIIKYLFATCAEEDKNEQTLYNIMYIGYRMTYNGNFIIKELSKHNESYWESADRWYSLIQYLKTTRDDPNKKTTKNDKIKKAFKSGLNWITTNNPYKISTDKRIRSEKIIADAKAYDILCEINYYMSRLELTEKFIFDFMVQASAAYGVSKENTKKLLKYHYFNKQNHNTKSCSNQFKRKKRLEEKYKNINREKIICICVGKCLPFLQANSKLLQLRLVNSLWATQLKQKIGKRFLIQQRNETLLSKIRIKAYQGFCPSAVSEKIFKRMVQEMPDFTEHSDIIVLDVRRSLAWDESLRQTLVNILKCFAFYHPNVGYLQGMNYLCENILKLTDQKYQVYKIFQYLMNNPFYGMYSANFDGLRTKIYQFMRIVQIEKPKLYEHFQTEKLEGEHFILPWAITLWGEMSGDLCWVLWDGFICKGWKWWFKTMLWLLNILQPDLLVMNFEQMMKCFSELSTGLLNMNLKQLKQFGIDVSQAKKQIDEIPLHDDLLKDIEKEYKMRVQMINEYLKKLITPKKIFK